MPVLQDYITAFHRNREGMRSHPEHADFHALFKADPAMLEEARAELSRLDRLDAAFAGQLHNRDYSQSIKRLALSGMLAAHQEQTK